MKKSLILALTIFEFFTSNVRAGDDEKDWQTPLLTSLKSHYEITTRDFMGKVKKPGIILTVVQDGIQTDEPKVLMKHTTIQDGKITKGGGGSILTGMGGRSLKQGDRVYVYDVRVHDDDVTLIIATVNTIDVVQRGKTKSTVQEAALLFHLENGVSATPESVIAMIKPWLVTEAEAASTKTVAIGQTTQEVEKAFGHPEKMADLKTKVIYYYKDMKVVFVDGKVSDVQ